MARKKTKPFDDIVMTHAKLRMHVQYGAVALQDQPPEEFLADVLRCFDYLMMFRNMVSMAASFDMTPEEAAAQFAPDETAKAA